MLRAFPSGLRFSGALFGCEARVTARAERNDVRGVICAAVAARNDVVRAEIVRGVAFATRAVPGNDEPG